ncbi:unnamed protein product [Thlaspi arvense]|uniref:Uncharacterized protein n=1 Tax=Thlaspi arvense TaxID=13288 RepID=A0AAU9SKY6_THLAR|nr:unnamed protein product [Thlaspi arvense]
MRVKVDLRVELNGMESNEILTAGVSPKTELECYRNECIELESSSKEAEDRCAALEQKIERRKSEFELLDGRFTALEIQKNVIEEEVRVLKQRNAELEKRIAEVQNYEKVVHIEKGMREVVDLAENDEEKIIQLGTENEVLKWEKKIAESNLEVWVQKCRELESRLIEVQKENLVLRQVGHKEQTKDSGMKDGLDVVTSLKHLKTGSKMADKSGVVIAATDTPSADVFVRQSEKLEGRKIGFFDTEMDNTRARKRLAFGEEGILGKKLAPSTPGGARPPTLGIIQISDSEDDPDDEVACVSTEFLSGGALGGAVINISKKTVDDQLKNSNSDEEDMNSYKQNVLFVPTPKRKRASNVVTSETESDDDDDLPIGKLHTKSLKELNHEDIDLNMTATVTKEKVSGSATPRRRLVALRKCSVKTVHSPSNSDNKVLKDDASENDEMKEDVSESDTEGESLGGFIVESSDKSDEYGGGSISSASDDKMGYNEVMSRIRRNRDHKIKWEFEGDMLAAFGKDTALCMRAVCALYRQQTSDEKSNRWTIHSNQRGFNQCDARRGSTLAEFLTDGDPKADVMKSIEELQRFDPRGPDVCRTLATRYSKQLFAIYQNKEDPFFLPS